MTGDEILYVHLLIEDALGRYMMTRSKDRNTTSVFDTEQWNLSKLCRKNSTSAESVLYREMYSLFGVAKPTVIFKREIILLGQKTAMYKVKLESPVRLIVSPNIQIAMVSPKKIEVLIEKHEEFITSSVKYLKANSLV